jgi:teichuronic acid biosynthesis glycosyltransferase TuaC
MLRVLTIATLFPDAQRPNFGIFVERQTLGLAALEGVAVEVVSPVGLPPWPLRLHPHYRDRARLPLRETWNGLVVHRPRFPVWPKLGEARAGRAMAAAILPVVHEMRPEVIDAEFFWPDGVAAMHLAAALKIPFSIKARGSDIAYWGQRDGVSEQMKLTADKADGLLAVSQGLKRLMVGLGMPEGKIRVHHTGVDLERFRPCDREAAKAALGVEGPLIATVGALIPLKGQKLALAALAEVPGATLMLIGEGPDRAALEAEARRLGVEDRARFLGNRPHDELPGLLAAADLMLLPSEREGLANAWVEALACGTPIVVPDVGGARELLEGREAGRLVAREPGAIADAIRSILASPPDSASVRAAVEPFSWERNARELAEHLRGLRREAIRRA